MIPIRPIQERAARAHRGRNRLSPRRCMMRSNGTGPVLFILAVLSMGDAPLDCGDRRLARGAETKPEARPSPVVGTWDAEARHLVMRSLFQPVMGTRLRSTRVHFKQDGTALVGFSLVPE